MPMVPPGGMSVLYVNGCTAAHVAAAERGVSGERYLVADQHVTCADLAAEISRQSGAKLPRSGPVWLVQDLAGVSAPLARTFGFRPLVAPGQLTFMLWNAHVDASKAPGRARLRADAAGRRRGPDPRLHARRGAAPGARGGLVGIGPGLIVPVG